MSRKRAVIAGSGAAGMMAGIALADAGYEVTILEKAGNGWSSNAARAGGPALAGTDLQKKEGVDLTPEALYDHMYRFSRGTVNAGLLRRAVSEGNTVYRILERNGIAMHLLPDTYNVGFRARHFYGCPPKQKWEPLIQDFEAKGGTLVTSMAAKEIIFENGSAAGILAENQKTGELVRYTADAVLIATGGYLGSEEMKKEHFGEIHAIALGSPLSDGTGIRMAMEAGGIPDRNWGLCCNEFSGANHKLMAMNSAFFYAVCGGLLVGSSGERFMNEQWLSDEPLSVGGEISLRAGRFYSVLDSDMYEALFSQTPYEYFGSPEGWIVGRNTLNNHERLPKRGDMEKAIAKGVAAKAETLTEAGAVFGLACLEESADRYNALCDAGVDTDFGKAPWLLRPVRKPPFYVVENEPSAWCTIGGVMTDDRTRLLDGRRAVIPGVYVAGIDNGSAFCVPYYDNEGACLGTSMTTGIVAARAIMEDLDGKEA